MLTIPQNPADGIAAVRERITVAAIAAGRDPATVTRVRNEVGQLTARFPVYGA